MNPWIEPDADVRCADSCGRIATDERLVGITDDGTEISELVCVWHAEHPEEGNP